MVQSSTNVSKGPLRLAQTLIGSLTLLIIMPPILIELGFNRLGSFLYNVLGFLCHQRADRSLFLFGDHFLYSKSEFASQVPFDKIFTIDIPQRFACSSTFGCKFGVCSRCTGIYLGLLIGLLVSELMLHWKIPKIIPILLIVPLVLDGGIQTVAYIFAPEHGFYESTNPRRFFTGLLFGLGLGYLLASAIMPSIAKTE